MNVTIQPIPCPTDRPTRPEPNLTIAWVACHHDNRLSQRHVAHLFRKSGRRVAAHHLHKLVRNNWLTITDIGGGPTPIKYGLGSRAKKESDTWTAQGDALYGPMGLLAALLRRPAITRAVLAPSGALVAGLLLSDGVHSIASGTVRLNGLLSRNTVSARLRDLDRLGLAVSIGNGEFSAVCDFSHRLSLLERSSGASEQCHHQERRWASERASYHQSFNKGNCSPTRSGPSLKCVFGCNSIGNTQEHFPPKHWHCPLNDPRFIWGACLSCNSRQGTRIRSMPQPILRPYKRPAHAHEIAQATYTEAFAAYRKPDQAGLERSHALVSEFLPLWIDCLPRLPAHNRDSYHRPRRRFTPHIQHSLGELHPSAPESFGGKYGTAIHEAGHAVVNELVGDRVQSLSIRPDSETKGRVRLADKWPEDLLDYVDIPFWHEPEMAERLRKYAIPTILGTLAGPMAQERICGEWNHVGATSDMDSIYGIVSKAFPDDPGLNAGFETQDGLFQPCIDLAIETACALFGPQCDALLTDNWDWVTAVADAAMKYTTLSGDQIRALRPTGHR